MLKIYEGVEKSNILLFYSKNLTNSSYRNTISITFEISFLLYASLLPRYSYHSLGGFWLPMSRPTHEENGNEI